MIVGSVVAALGGSSAPALGASFGTPLGTAPFNVAPNNPYDCSTYVASVLGSPTAFPVYGPAGPPSVATSCIWAHVPTPAETQAFGGANISLEPPGTGTVTQVRVAVGPTTGPMQVVVMRALYSNTTTPGRPNDACCFPVARSQVFTPQANTISTVAVNLPVKEDPTPPPEDITTIADFDTLGLAVLAPRVPVPMYYTGDLSAPADFFWNTSTPSTVVPGFSGDTGGFFVALSATWTAGGGRGGGGGGAPIGFGGGGARIRNGNAGVPLRCATAAGCAGQLLLQSAKPAGAEADRLAGAARAGRPVNYGKASFTISGHGHKTISVKLNRAGRKLLGRRNSVKVWAVVRLKGRSAPYASHLTLHR